MSPTLSDSQAPARVAVVIPYYQREPGLLRRALDSVNAQDLAEPVRVWVVDDASPHPAREELADWRPGEGVALELIEQANAGPGLARNRALDALDDAVTRVAFLDSDDRWHADHLRLALAALDTGAALYFADTFFEDAASRLMAKMVEQLPEAHAGEPLCGGLLERAILAGFVHTPTVVYRRDSYPDVRFPAGFYRFGEDQTFWLTLCGRGACGEYCADVQAVGGLGVNIYAGATWGTPAQFATTAHEIRYRRHALARLSLTPAGRESMAHRLRLARANMGRQMLHHLRRGNLADCARQLGEDPAGLLALFGAMVAALRRTPR